VDLAQSFVMAAWEKPIFRPLSKNNTGMAALRGGLPVTRVQVGMTCKLATRHFIPLYAYA